MKDVIFREYDIRGIVDQEFILADVYDLACAIASYFSQRNPHVRTIALAIDGRTHSPRIQEEIYHALTDSGLDVVLLGVCPTPALYFSLFTEDVDGGIMVTASHNAKEYNGLKICLGTESIWGKELQVIKDLFHKRSKKNVITRGMIRSYPIAQRYTAWLAHHFEHLTGARLPFIIDCGNGATGTVLPALIKALDWQHVTLLYPDVDGTYPNHEADPTIAEHMKELKKQVTTTSAQFGVGLDGDGDRMIPMTKEGNLVPGDQLLALFAQQILQKHPQGTIVFDVKSSAGLIDLIKKWGGNGIMSPSGHSIIKNVMQEHKAIMGGELSGHFFFKDRYFGYDDGIYAMLRLYELILQSGSSLTELLAIFPPFFSSPELRIACPDSLKQKVMSDLKHLFTQLQGVHITTVDGLRITFSQGWGLIRPSNTQAMLSMRFEAATAQDLKKIASVFYAAVTPYLAPAARETFRAYMDTL